MMDTDAFDRHISEIVQGSLDRFYGNGHEADPDGLTTWEPYDLGPILEGTEEPVRPTILMRSDGLGLFYAGRINTIAGESGHGKSWVALAAIAETLTEGGAAGYIDLEDHPRSIVGRLLALGVAAQAIAERFFYMRPERRSGLEALESVDRLIVEHEIASLVIDSVGEAMALQGMKQNDDDAVADWYRHHARRWAALGPAVILVDHVPKSPDAPKLFAIGSQRKRAAIDGAGYRAEQVRPMAVGEHGTVSMLCAKDRHGTFPIGSEVALCHFKSSFDGPVIYEIALGAERDDEGKVMRPTFIMERVSKVLEYGPALTGRQVESQVRATTKTRSTTLRDALRVLVAEGFVGAHEGPRRAVFYHSIKPFRDEADALETLGASSASEFVPSEAGTQWTHATEQCVRASHPLGGDALDALAVGATEEDGETTSVSKRDIW